MPEDDTSEMIGGSATTELASNRTGLAFERTMMGADRTLMAIVRTALLTRAFRRRFRQRGVAAAQ